MTRTDALRILRAHRAELEELGATRLFLFGSVARDEAAAASDIDLFFDYDDPSYSLIEVLRLRDRLEAILAQPTDLMTRAGLHPHLRPGIEHSAIQVF